MRGDTAITNSEDVIDSRDIIERIKYLEDLEETWNDAKTALEELEGTDAPGEDDKTAEALEAAREAVSDAEIDFGDDERDELRALRALAEEGESATSEWKDGAGLIRDSYFREYAEQFADDIGAINRESTWPNNHIDWEAAADELKMDYTSVDFDGVEYWVRSA